MPISWTGAVMTGFAAVRLMAACGELPAGAAAGADDSRPVAESGQIIQAQGHPAASLAQLGTALANTQGLPTRPLVTPIGSRELVIRFVAPGSHAPAPVAGLGAVFSKPPGEGAYLAFIDAEGRLLQQVRVPAEADSAGAWFAGISFPRPVIAQVRIRTGRATITGLYAIVGETVDSMALRDFAPATSTPVPARADEPGRFGVDGPAVPPEAPAPGPRADYDPSSRFNSELLPG